MMTSPSNPTIEPTENVVYLGLLRSDGTYELQEPSEYWTEVVGTSEEERLYGYLQIKNIENPQYNTVYKIVDSNGENPLFVIYYIDQG